MTLPFGAKGLPKVKRQIFYDVAFWSKGLPKVNRQIRCPSDLAFSWHAAYA